MFKITIDNEEVITDKDFTIEEEMLNTPSVILNNVYPKEWEQDKDYLNFYHPNEYSKCKIFNEEITPASEGLTVEGTSFQITYDDTKEFNLLSLEGDTSQSGTPTPTSPVAVDTVTGRQDIQVAGKNLFDYTTTVFTNPSYVNIETQDETITITTLSTQTSNNLFLRTKIPDNLLQHGATYTISSENVSGMVQSLKLQLRNKNGNNAGQPTGYSITYDDTYSLYIVCNPFATTDSTSIPAGTTAIVKNVQVEKSSSSSTYESFKEHNYEINLGKNLFDLSTITYTTNGRVNITIDNNSITQKNTSTYARGTYYLKNLEIGTTYTLNMDYINENSCSIRIDIYNSTDTTQKVAGTATTNTSGNLSTTFTATETTQCLRIYSNTTGTSNSYSVVYTNIQLEKGSQKISYSPYKTPIELCKIGNYQDYIFKNTTDSDYYDNTLEEGAWYLHKAIGKVVLNGSESGWASAGNNTYAYTGITNYLYTNEVIAKCNYYNPIQNGTYGSITNNSMRFRYHTDNAKALYIRNDSLTSLANFKTWLSNHNVSVYYVLDTATTELIEDTELLGQLEEINLLNGLNNISVSSPYLLTPIKIHYNFNEEIINQDLYFCGVVKNSGNISLNPREPHFQSLQVLSYKTFLSEGETLDFVIYQKTIREAIEQVVGVISDYGFIVGDINILNPDEIIGAYSTKDKSAYDVFQYIADITQSRWTTRMVDEDTIAIDFYDPSLMQLGTTLDYTQEFFSENLIDNMTYSYGTNDYRNKQVMTSQEVYSNINQVQNIVANGYQTQFNTEQQIGKINSIKISGVDYTFATNTEKDMGVIADFYYSAGNNYFESASTISIGTVIVIDYLPIVEGRQIITNSNEIDRVANSTGVKGVVARYENRNDATTSTELQLIGQSYIKYKGVPEIVLTITTRKDLWNVGQRVQFNAPLNELAVMYMVRKKSIHRITTIDTIFYTFELVSSFNSETAVNYFDNQRAKANGNIGEGEYISRNIDIQSTANIIFYDTQANEITVIGDNELNCTLESPFVV